MQGQAGLGLDIRVRLEIGQFFSAVDYVKAQRLRALLRSSMIAAMADADAIITPTIAPLVPEIGSAGNSIQGSAPHSRESAHFSAPYNATGMPAITIPCAIDSRGAPIGLQMRDGRAMTRACSRSPRRARKSSRTWVARGGGAHEATDAPFTMPPRAPGSLPAVRPSAIP